MLNRRQLESVRAIVASNNAKVAVVLFAIALLGWFVFQLYVSPWLLVRWRTEGVVVQWVHVRGARGLRRLVVARNQGDTTTMASPHFSTEFGREVKEGDLIVKPYGDTASLNGVWYHIVGER